GDAAGAYALAAALPSELERRTLEWAAIYYGHGAIDYHAVSRFAAEAPDFGSDGLFRSRIEQALTGANPGDADVISYLGGSMPNSVKGDLMLASAYARQGESERARRIVTTIWDDYALNADDEKLVLDNAGKLLTPDRASSASRMLPLLSPAQRSLVAAGIAVINNASNAHDLLDKVDPSLRTSPVFYFLAAQNARLTGDFTRALADLNAPDGTLPDAP